MEVSEAGINTIIVFLAESFGNRGIAAHFAFQTVAK
jgi:hypothetical protein